MSFRRRKIRSGVKDPTSARSSGDFFGLESIFVLPPNMHIMVKALLIGGQLARCRFTAPGARQ